MSSKITIKPSGFKYLFAALVILLIVYSFKLNSDYQKLEDAFSEQKIELQAVTLSFFYQYAPSISTFIGIWPNWATFSSLVLFGN